MMAGFLLGLNVVTVWSLVFASRFLRSQKYRA